VGITALYDLAETLRGLLVPANSLELPNYNVPLAKFQRSRKCAGIEYFIVPEGPNWAVRIDSDSTPYQTLAEAIEAAMEVARGARRCGFAAAVFVHRAQGGWTSLLHL
jgi:Uncharacterized protein conserved in bacteria (DUF2188)